MVSKKNSPKSTTKTNHEEKQQLINELKQTMHDLGRLPGLIVAPVIAFISARYETIPAKRRAKLEEIVHNLKNEGTEGLVKLKDWFLDVSNNFTEKAENKIKEVSKKQGANAQETATKVKKQLTSSKSSSNKPSTHKPTKQEKKQPSTKKASPTKTKVKKATVKKPTKQPKR